MQLVECVANVSEGRDSETLRRLRDAIVATPNVALLHEDAGYDANRTVFSFAGPPDAVGDAAFRLGATAAREIDMRNHAGAHPCLGALDVCPFVPLVDLTIGMAATLARNVGSRLASEVGVPIYLYEHAAARNDRRLLARVRRDGYAGLAARLEHGDDPPDFGPQHFTQDVARTGASIIGARNILLAYNINVATTDVTRVRPLAARLRESGATGAGETRPGMFKGLRCIAWYMPAFGCCQISMNVTDLHATHPHEVFVAAEQLARDAGLRVTGSELVGLTPRRVLLDAGAYFLWRRPLHDDDTTGDDATAQRLTRVAIERLGLSSVKPFDPETQVLEAVLRRHFPNTPAIM